MREISISPLDNAEYPEQNSPVEENYLKICERVTLVALPFFALYKPLSLPISLGKSGASLYKDVINFGLLINSDINECNVKPNPNESYFNLIRITITVISIGSAIFSHPIGMILTTSQNIIIELNNLHQGLQDKNIEKCLIALIKNINNVLSLALISTGGLNLSIISLALKATVLLIASRDEFKKGRILEGSGNLLMAAIRLNQGYSQFKILERQWEIEGAVKRVFVGELHEKWQFPSDHLPVGIEVNGVKIIS